MAADCDLWSLSHAASQASASSSSEGESLAVADAIVEDCVAEERPSRAGRPSAVVGGVRCIGAPQVRAAAAVDSYSALAQMMRVEVGSEIHRSIAIAVRSKAGAVTGPDIAELIGRFLGPQPKCLMPSVAEARLAGQSLRTFKRHVIELASSVFSSRAWLGALCSRLLAEADRGALKLHGAYTFVLYDETPLSMRGQVNPQEKARINP